jgi:hypothetical protein
MWESKPHSMPVRVVVYSSDDAHILSGSDDTTVQVCTKKLNKTKWGDLYSAYSALSGGSRHLEQSVLSRQHSRQATTMGAYVLLPLAVNSESE